MISDHDSSGTTDEAVALAVAGDRAALEALLRRHALELCSGLTISARWRRSFEVEDLLQVTSMEAILRIETLRTPTLSGFRAWFAKMAENNLRDAIRGLETQKRTPPGARVTHDSNGRSARTLLAAVSSQDPSASAVMRRAEDVERLRLALGKLPPTYRAVVERLDLAERPVGEVADDLGRSPGAVHMLHMRALERLRELLV